jgi:hypothetical protein
MTTAYVMTLVVYDTFEFLTTANVQEGSNMTGTICV